MPLYEYECLSCQRRFEQIQKFSDPPVTECPSCGGGPVQKLISSPAIQFKGSGFYITDYARSGAAAEKASPDKAAAGTQDSGGDSASTKSETPAASTKSEAPAKTGTPASTTKT